MENKKKGLASMAFSIILIFALSACGSSMDVPEKAEEKEVAGQQHEEAQTSEAKEGSTVQIAEQTEEDTKEQTDNNEEGTDKSDDILILYFSADNTKDVDAISSATPMADGVSAVEWIADIIQENIGGDLVPIIPSEDYPLEYDELADYAKKEADNDTRPPFEDLGVDPTSYKTVFIGYPVWWYTTPKILETLFETYDFSGITIVPFNTHAGSRDGGTYSLIKEREPEATVLDGLAVRGNDIGNDEARNTVIQWLQGLNLE